MLTKICGITHLADAKLAEKYGAWAIGFNFYKASARYISIHHARLIASQLAPNLVKVGIFIDACSHDLTQALSFLDYVQIYQPTTDLSIDKKRIILAVNTDSHFELPTASVMSEYAFILLDAPKAKDGLLGGTGRLACWKLAAQLAKTQKLILAGGLNPENIKQAIAQVNPAGVDVASGIENHPRSKNTEHMQTFLRSCHEVN